MDMKMNVNKLIMPYEFSYGTAVSLQSTARTRFSSLKGSILDMVAGPQTLKQTLPCFCVVTIKTKGFNSAEGWDVSVIKCNWIPVLLQLLYKKKEEEMVLTQ